MLKSYEETIDEVVKSDVVQPLPDANRRATQAIVRGQKNFSAIPVNCSSEPFPHDRVSLSKALLVDYKQIKNTLSCSHEDRACICVTLLRENKNIKDKYSRDYRKQMFKKAKSQFTEFYNLFRYFDRKFNEEKRRTYKC
jgi:hypothetical protein